MLKFVLIVSQYYHSRHMFIVKRPDNFLEVARGFSKELMIYKRDEGNVRELFLGDIDPEYSGNGERRRYNINDSGDIYFHQAEVTNVLMWESWDYRELSRKEGAGFKKKSVKDEIEAHHNYRKVAEIVKKHFEIA